MEKAKIFFENYIGETALDFFSLAQSGSSRMNFVGNSSNQKYIITFNENVSENESFLYFSQVFSDLNLNGPKIFSVSDDRKTYVQEFLGENTLSEIIEKEGLSENVKSLVKETLQKLFDLQQKTAHQIDYSRTFEYEKYDEFPITNDLFYFKNFIVDVLELPYQKASLLKEFKEIVSKIENLEPKGLMIRDFQSRNIMVNSEQEIYFIDYQSAMKGPLMYDVVSFLFQAKANFPEDFKNEMLQFYYDLWKDSEKKSALKNSLQVIKLIRFLQVLGAYGFRGLIQRKKHFLASLDQGIDNVFQLSNSWEEMNNYPELKKIITDLTSSRVKERIHTLI